LVERHKRYLFLLASHRAKDGLHEESLEAWNELLEMDSSYAGAEDGFFKASQELERHRRDLRADAARPRPKNPPRRKARRLEAPKAPEGPTQQQREEAESHYQLGLAHYATGDAGKARTEMEKAAAADPDHPYAKSALASLRQQVAQEAESDYQSGLAYYATGDLVRAREQMEKAVQADPEHEYARSAPERLQREPPARRTP
jgi:tetratricopeptide (TPR) repeat protein